jgi:hypothetical protein
MWVRFPEIASSRTPPWLRPSRRALVLTALAVAIGASCRGGGCGERRDVPPTSVGPIALLPAEAQVLVSIDFAKIRGTPLWQRLSALAEANADDKRRLAELSARTGLDPFRHVHRIVAAFPEEARLGGGYAVVVEGEGFDEKRLVAFARDEAKREGGEIRPRTHRGRTLWGTAVPKAPAGVFLGPGRFALGAGGWAERIVDLAGGAPGAAGLRKDLPLVRIGERVGGGRAFWFSALVPESTRKRLLADPKYDVQASVTKLAGGGDLGPGLVFDVVAELTNATDAQALVAKVQAFVRGAKQSPQALLLGLGPYLDAVTAQADGPTVRLEVALSAGQTEDLVTRLSGLVKLGRAANAP